MTLGPRLATGAPVAVPVAVAERFFQTIFGSCWSVSALASTSSVLTEGFFGSAVPGIAPAFQVTVPLEIVAPSALVNVVPSTGGTGTLPPSTGAAPKLLTRTKNGYESRVLTEPRWKTKEFPSPGPAGASTTAAWAARGCAVAARLVSVAPAGSACRPRTSV